jgi:ABC-type branched-subunit amino acid transport system permease subunit
MSTYWQSILIVAGINAILAWSLGLVVRSGQLSVGHAALAGVGGYTAGYLTLHGYSPAVAFLCAPLATAVVGSSWHWRRWSSGKCSPCSPPAAPTSAVPPGWSGCHYW